MAHWVYDSESLYVGHAGKLHSIAPKSVAELYLERSPEYGTTSITSPIRISANVTLAWNGGRLAAVCITAIWPSFAKIPNTLSPSIPTTTYEMIGFTVFWIISVPFLFIRPEHFKRPFQFISIYCGLGMLCMMIWSLSVARGVGPIFSKGQTVKDGSQFNTSWLMMAGINQAIGQNAAGMTNSSDFSRYAKKSSHYLIGTISCLWFVGALVSFVGLVTTAACQKIYGKIYWNPPDLLMVMMNYGEGSSAARAAVFFLALGFGLTSMFENICGNSVAGGIDLAGLFPRYINIRRGAIITFLAAWVCFLASTICLLMVSN